MLYNYVNFIVATDNKGGIGKEGQFPWILLEDLKYFQQITKDHFVVMGSKTYFSFPEKYTSDIVFVVVLLFFEWII